MSIFFFFYLYAFFIKKKFLLYLDMVNYFYIMINNLFTIINYFYFVVSNLYTIINKSFIKKIFLLIVSKMNMKLNKNSKV